MDFQKVTAFLDDLERTYGVPGADCIVQKDHQVIYRHQTGCRDYGKSIPVDGSELYDVYSMTKVVTMTAVMQLVERGILALEDPVTKYLPVFANTKVADDYDYKPYTPPLPGVDAPAHLPEKPICLADLMGMTSGMSYDLGNPVVQSWARETNGDTVTMMEAIAKLPLLFEPGTRYCYSLGHDVMGAVVEKASGERFEDYVKRHIFAPLEAADVTFHPGEMEKPRMADQWTMLHPSEQVVPDTSGNDCRLTEHYDSGGGGLCCSVEAYAAFADALACGGVGKNGARIVSMESINRLRTPRLNEQQQEDFARGDLGYSYGLGVRTLVYPSRSKSPVGEFGWDGAAGAFCLMDTENKLSVVYAQQVRHMPKAYLELQPKLRDLIYEALEA